MYIISVSDSRIGYYLARALLSLGHEILAINSSPQECDRISEELGSVTLCGDGCDVQVLEEAGTNRADLFVALNSRDEDNLVACQIAKKKFNVPRTIALVHNPDHVPLFKKLGIEVTVSAITHILEEIESVLPAHPLLHLLELKGPGLEIVSAKISPDSSLVGKRLGELSLPPGVLIPVVVGKGKKLAIAAEDTILEPEDEVVALLKPEAEEALRAIFFAL